MNDFQYIYQASEDAKPQAWHEVSKCFMDTSSYLEWLQDAPTSPHFGGYPEGASRTMQFAQNKCPYSFEECTKLGTLGWAEGRKKLEKWTARFTDKIQGVRMHIRYNLTGSTLDVGRFVEGEPECFRIRKKIKDKPQPRVLRIVMGLAGNFDKSADYFFNRGASMAALVDILEGQGIRCEVIIYFGRSLSKSNAEQTLAVCLKQAGEPVDMDKIAFWVCHVGAARRLAFSGFNLGGFDHSMSDTHAAEDKELERTADILLAGSTQGNYGLPWIKKEAAKYGVGIELKETADNQ